LLYTAAACFTQRQLYISLLYAAAACFTQRQLALRSLLYAACFMQLALRSGSFTLACFAQLALRSGSLQSKYAAGASHPPTKTTPPPHLKTRQTHLAP